jgi:hypothetical protein
VLGVQRVPAGGTYPGRIRLWPDCGEFQHRDHDGGFVPRLKVGHDGRAFSGSKTGIHTVISRPFSCAGIDVGMSLFLILYSVELISVMDAVVKPARQPRQNSSLFVLIFPCAKNHCFSTT